MAFPTPEPHSYAPNNGGGYGAPHHQVSTYPGGPQSSNPGYGGGYHDGNYGGSPAPYGAGPTAHQQPAYGAGPPQSQGSAGEYYGGQPGAQAGGPQGQEQLYDEHGNLIPPGERGLGTMAMGGIVGLAANKMTGGGHGKMASIGTGALLAQGGKMAYEWFDKKQKKPSHAKHGSYGSSSGGGAYGGGAAPGGYGGGSHGGGGGGGSFFGKRDI